MDFLEQIRRAIFGPPKRKKKRNKRRGSDRRKSAVKTSYTQQELRDLVRSGKANVKPHRK